MTVIELISELTRQDIRLWLEDGQLRFSAPKGGMSEATRQLIRDNKPAIMDFLRENQASQLVPLEQVDRHALQPLSNAQERIWFLSQLEPDNTVFHLPMTLALQGPLDIAALGQALNAIIERHSILRTAYVQDASGTWQKILPRRLVTLAMESHERLLDQEAIRAIEARQTCLPFRLETGDVTHQLLVTMPEHHYVLFLTIHHIASDGWSMGIIGQEIVQLYSAIKQQAGDPLAVLPWQYVDYAAWQHRNTARKPLQEQLAFWRQALAEQENLDFPADFTRQANPGHASSMVTFVINSERTHRLQDLARQHHTTLFAVTLSLFGLLLYRYTRQSRFCVGTPVAGRPHSGLEPLVGCFLNLLALPLDHDGEPGFAALLERNRDIIHQAFAHQDIPFEEVVRAVVSTRNLDITPLFQVLFGFHNAPTAAVNEVEGIRIESIFAAKQATLYDLSLNLREWNGELHGELDYRNRLFRPESMQALADSFLQLIDSVIASPQTPVSRLVFISAADRLRQQQWNATDRQWPAAATVHAMIEEQAHLTPDTIAVRFRDQALSYRELEIQSNRLAHHLRQQGVGNNAPVGVFLERSLELPVALLAILKAGGCYVPLDTGYPQNRLDTIAADAGLQWLVTHSERAQWQLPPGLKVTCLDDSNAWQNRPATPVPAATHPRPLFNIIYTSGSTGKPKGVVISHAAIINRLRWMQDTFALTAADRVLHKTPYSFDVSVWEVFWPLLAGAQLVLAEPEGHRNPAYLHELIDQQAITVTHFVPSMLSLFLQEQNSQHHTSLQQLFCSGETLSPALANRFLELYPDTRLVNLYGPTEAAIDVSCHVCEKQARVVPIGKPISNTRLHVLDEHLQLLPAGATGEIAISGAGLAEGYLHQATLTTQAFVDNPFEAGTRLYKTGDLGRFDHEGNLLFLGRIDHQIKVRGLRVEPGEIENLLNCHPAIRESLIDARQDSSHSLSIVAYYLAAEAVEPASLRDYLALALPAFMIPNAFIELQAWPLQANGKINRKALPAPHLLTARSVPFVAPRDTIEERIAAVWKELLNLPDIGIYDNFFEAGGHSLLATIAITRLQNEFGVKIALNEIFREPTVATFAAAIRSAQNQSSRSGSGQP